MEGKKIVEYRCNLCGPDSAPKEYCGNTSNLRTHLAHYWHKGALVDIKTENCETEIDLQTGGESSSTKKGSIEALLPQSSAEQRDRLHRSTCPFWLVRRGRALTLPQKDMEFRAIFDNIFKGGYTPPSYQTVVDLVLTLSAEGKAKVSNALAALYAEGISPSIGESRPSITCRSQASEIFVPTTS
ncbi:hypothetical protein CYMTET_54858 [Cymbomonas tetramitiformis]|uniref:BED-type domain-containing protein n=1 Tax=Cymbomonas tetramitiformis TaxID=36881 RepID=A0AAE0BFG3_9CHLO|nr:hypothetical protein CYMTET_54858 [Cymbomonas tetramitiformis]